MSRLSYYGSPGSSTSSGQVVSGPKGDPGSPGPIGTLYGSGAPSDSVGVNGQGYFDEVTGDQYVKENGTWGSPIINLKGPEGDPGSQGPQGPQGAAGTNGAAGATGAAGAKGDGYQAAVAWQANTAYNVSNGQRPVVTYQGETYFSNSNVPSRTTFTAGDWTKMAAKGADGSASIPSNVVLRDAANTFAVAEQNGGLFTFLSYNFTEMPTLTITSANEANYTGREVGFTSNTGTNIFELRIDGTVSKGFNMKVRREGTAKVRIVPNNTNAVGHSEQIPTIDATHPAYIANQYGAAIVEVRFKANGSSCDFLVDANLATS